jgi:hypothetical protein
VVGGFFCKSVVGVFVNLPFPLLLVEINFRSKACPQNI